MVVLANYDINIGHDVATNAFGHNFTPSMMKALVTQNREPNGWWIEACFHNYKE